ncbi:hypothetical protein ACHAP5_011975 [Fusarium lateritium]
MSILRTRIVQQSSSDAGLQAVIKSDTIQWRYVDDLEAYPKTDKAMSMDLGEPLVRLAMIRDGFLGHNYLVWTIHHAVYDGQSLPAIQNMVHHIYHDHSDMIPNHQGWSKFVGYSGPGRNQQQVILGQQPIWLQLNRKPTASINTHSRSQGRYFDWSVS